MIRPPVVTNWRLRPSAAAVWVICPGMLRMSAGVVFDDADPTVREEGTACHLAAHNQCIGQPVAVGTIAPNGVEIDGDMLEACGLYQSAIAAWPTAAPRYFETPTHCADIHPECGGTPDVFAWCPVTRTIYLGDLKYGYRPVHAYANWQLLCYVSGVMRHFGLQAHDVERVEFMIVQPRAYGRDPVQSAVMPMHEVLQYWETLRNAALQAVALDSVCVTNSACLDCEGRHQCPALRSAALRVLDAAHAATPEALPFAAAENELRVLTWARGIVDARISGLEQQVKHGMTNGQRAMHWDLEPSTARLRWRDGVAEQVRAIGKLTGANIEKPSELITPTQAKKLLGENLVNMLAERPPGALKLVPSDAQKWARIFGDK